METSKLFRQVGVFAALATSTIVQGADEAPLHFAESNFGVSFSYSALLKTSYDPHGAADRVLILRGEETIGALLIRPAPPSMDADEFIESGKEHFRRTFGSAEVSYEALTTPDGYRFHHFVGVATNDGVSYVVERYIHLRGQSAKQQTKDLTAEQTAQGYVDSLAGAIVIEFFYRTDDTARTAKDLRGIVDTFAIRRKDQNQRPEGTPGKSPSSNPSQVPGVAHP